MILGVTPFAFGVVVVFALTRRVHSGKNFDAPPARSRTTIVLTNKSKTGTRRLKCGSVLKGRAKLTNDNITKR